MEGIRYYFNNVNGNIEIKKCNNSIHSSKPHFHNEISIGLVEKGGCKTEICGNTYDLTEKTILIIPPTSAHKCNPYNYKHWGFRMLYINKEWFETAFDNNIENNFSYMKLNEIMFNSIVSLFSDIQNSIINMEIESKLLKYVSLLANRNNKDYPRSIIGSLNSDKINEIKKYLDENYLNNIMLSDLAKVAGMSKYYLIRQFEKQHGLSPHKYITNLRINHAKKLLKNNNDFADIALESGFYDQSHFTKYFKEYTGVTPMKYKTYI
ncbi:AraC family transcriptional regulator [Clostridium sp. WILCCON 0269]|uniref:AraC family transcriptional regulator n=1 Tax=Candidatus Clostridium eludens TaxID=3381663 RepID=A0ABW8SNW1_9CLOT